MRKFIYFATFLLFATALFSCSEKEVIEKITIDDKSLGIELLKKITSDGVSTEISFESTVDWNIAIDEKSKSSSWVRAVPSSGSAGKIVVDIICDENTTADDREATLKISTNELTHDIDIFQNQKNKLTITKSNFDANRDGESIEIEIVANVEPEFAIAEDCKLWVTKTETRGLTKRKFIYKISPNDSGTLRVGVINVSHGEINEEIRISQEAQEFLTYSTSLDGIMSHEGGFFQVFVETNRANIKLTQANEWITQFGEPVVDGIKTTYTYQISENLSTSQRSGSFLFWEGDAMIKMPELITQDGNEDAVTTYFKYTTSVEEVPAVGGEFKIIIDTNQPNTYINIFGEHIWVTLVGEPVTEGTITTYTYIFEENETGLERETVFIFLDGADLYIQCSVNQLATVK